MKTTLRLKSSSFPTLALLGIGIVTALVVQPVFGIASDHNFVITENSSTNLSVTYDGTALTVLSNPSFPDQWTFNLPTTFMSTVGTQQWAEPENSSLGNLVTFGSAITRQGNVSSDGLLVAGTPVNGNSPVQVGTDGGVAVFATFTDNAAAAESAPDTGSTFGLLSLALAALFGASRFRALRLA